MERGEIRWDRWFLILGFVFGLAFIISLPPGTTPDERSHLLRVSTIADGWLMPPRTSGSVEGYEVDPCLRAYSAGFVGTPHGAYEPRLHRPENCGPPVDARKVLGGGIRAMENYSPAPYVPAVVGYRIGRGLWGAPGSFYGARLFQLATYLAMGFVHFASFPGGVHSCLRSSWFPARSLARREYLPMA